MAEIGVNVDMIIQNLQRNQKNDITFTIDKESLKKYRKQIEEIAYSIGAESIYIDEEVAKVSIVGAGMITTPGIAGKMFRILGENNINIEMITTADIKISSLIHEKDAEKAVKVIHDGFELDKI